MGRRALMSKTAKRLVVCSGRVPTISACPRRNAPENRQTNGEEEGEGVQKILKQLHPIAAVATGADLSTGSLEKPKNESLWVK